MEFTPNEATAANAISTRDDSKSIEGRPVWILFLDFSVNRGERPSFFNWKKLGDAPTLVAIYIASRLARFRLLSFGVSWVLVPVVLRVRVLGKP